ncbi:MAG: hypothetical protein AAFS00_19750, partial [Bacteroidota bacterium]
IEDVGTCQLVLVRNIVQVYRILNVVQDLCLQGLHENQLVFSQDFILKGIKKELVKANKIF